MSAEENKPKERVGVYICHCGTNIAGVVNVHDVSKWAGENLSGQGGVVSRDYKFMCSSLGQELIQKDIKEQGLTRVVVAACSPHLHEPTFRTACKGAGLNPYLCELVSIREQDSWVHTDKVAATEKAKAIVAGGVSRVVHHEPLTPLRVPIHPATLIVGGGIAGIQAALEIADAGFPVYLVEREPSIGGHMAQFDKTFPTLDCSACILTPKMVQAGNHPNVTLLTYSEVQKVDGYVGNFAVTIKKRARWRTRTVKFPKAPDTCSTSLRVIRCTFLRWLTETILGVRMQAAQSSVGKVLSRRAMFPPIVDSRSTRYTSRPVSASSRAAWIPAMPPPTISVAGFSGAYVTSSGWCRATRRVAAATSAFALVVAAWRSPWIQAQCSRMLAIWQR